MTKASDNLFPYLHLVPAAAPAAPAAGSERVYLDSGDGNKLKRKNSAGSVTTIEGGSGGGLDSSAILTKSAVQTIAANTATAVTFDGEAEDNDNYHSNTTNTSRLTAPTAGVYIVSGSVELSATLASGKSMIVRIRKNGTDVDGDGRARMPGGSFTGVAFSRRVRMTAGDYVELIVEHSDTVSRDVRESINGTSFTITRIV